MRLKATLYDEEVYAFFIELKWTSTQNLPPTLSLSQKIYCPLLYEVCTATENKTRVRLFMSIPFSFKNV